MSQSVTTNSVFSVLDLPVHVLPDYVGWLEQRLLDQEGTHVVTLNAEMAMLTQSDPDLARIIRQAELVIPDGAGVILYMRLRGLKHSRCPGIELAESLLFRLGSREQKHSICFYGGKPGICDRAAASWQQKLPNVEILTNHGYLSESKQAEWQSQLKDKQPQVIFVGLGVPRQEVWIEQHRQLCPNSIWVGVGGSFDIWSGGKTRAPAWLRDNNLEWSYRLYQEPYRWRRMLALPKFFFLSLRK